ncbi:lactase/phlorizin hydrolase-like [Liolophura sinensis]|uniref:lactase/phlorizin hydrolase-like n=1 Tax=Liolophura sinensis TaxID=3198878 RepID=UPI0031595A31
MSGNWMLLLFSGLLCLSSLSDASIDDMPHEFYYGSFPAGFSWGTATASYQIEGAWDVDGKSESIWDTYCRKEGAIADGSNGTVACDSYHKYMEDVKLLKDMGVNHYRLSLSWPRIVPNPLTGEVNQQGLDYYNRVINALVEAGITPMVTLYHWDLPDILETECGGWLNESLVDYFNHYADVAFDAFGDRVKWWITFNEPWVQTLLGYGGGTKAPAVNLPATGPYQAGYVTLKAHAAAWHTYDKNYRPTQKGQISITLNSDHFTPWNETDPNDVEAADRQNHFMLGWFAHPIFVNGDYPDVMKYFLWRKSVEANVTNRLPQFTPEEKESIKGTFDFFGLNHYTSARVKYNNHGVSNPNYWTDADTIVSGDENWLGSGSEWLRVVPWGFRRLLVWIKQNYGDVPIMVTENGVSDRNGSLTDDHRIYYYKHYINEMLKAINLDGVNMIGYTAWSLLDNFEWEQGYVERFGLHYVNFTDPDRPRTAKKSARYLRDLFRANGFVNPNPPTAKPPPVCDGASSTRSFGVLALPFFACIQVVRMLARLFSDKTMARSDIVFSIVATITVVMAGFALGGITQMVDEFYYGKFPEGFSWGTATASYQIEGAWNVSGKGENIWDTFCRIPGAIANGSDGTVACDSYHKYEEDVALLKDMGVNHYRLSLSWSRILPDPLTGVVNRAGVDYYHRVIDALRAANIEPMVTLYHWDLPDILQTQFGGWKNETLVKYFTDFANVSFAEFGPKVKWWLTFNEPWVVTFLGYGIGSKAPGVKEPADGPYKTTHTIIKAHAAAWHLYNTTYRSYQNGKVSITLNCDYKQPYNPEDPNDLEASERQLQFMLGWYAHPIFVNGDYPDIMKYYVAKKSMGLSRLPVFTEEEKRQIKGTYDYFGLNHYTTQRVRYEDSGRTNPSWDGDQDVKQDHDPEWLGSGSEWLKVVPWAFRRLLVWIKDHYGNVPIMVTENGVSDRNGSLTDDHRISFYKQYINEMLKAINLDKVNVIGYTAWSLLDNFEWELGYEERFGVHFVNFTDPDRPRIPKKSATYLKKLVS